MTEKWEDPTHEANGPKFHTGKPCAIPGCDKPAGTAWDPELCWECNAERKRIAMKRINGYQFALNSGDRELAHQILNPKWEGES
jgi:hypothetical protein